MSEKNYSSIKKSAQKIAVLGFVGVIAAYGAQAMGVKSYNELNQHKYESEMVSTYNQIWQNINKTDVSDKIERYKELANNIPNELEVGLLLPKKTDRVLQVSSRLPSADNVEQAAIELNNKVSFKFSK